MTTTQASPLTREYKGRTIPAAGVYQIDSAHTTVEFVARHLMISKVRGRFEDVSGTVTIAEVPEESHVEVTIDPASVSTKEPARDEHLRSADFFDVDSYPTITFRSTALKLTSDNRFELTGELTLHGVTRPVVLDGEFEGANTSPWGTAAIGFSASTEIDRDDYGVSFNQVLETGGMLVGNKVRIELSFEANPALAEAA
ncbi:MAG TPA: YceI family protein [Acidimicrobiales bacterium]|nr:YceI family protein [Acidimicrobiales bacterium]